jgi:hypothetical protein
MTTAVISDVEHGRVQTDFQRSGEASQAKDSGKQASAGQ